MKTARSHRLATLAIASSLALACVSASAAVSAVGPAAFPSTSLLVDLSSASEGVDVHGLSVDGLTFSYSLGSGQLIIDGGPGITNSVAPPNVVSIGNPTGILGVALPGLSSMFGYGYALLSSGTVPEGTTISLFNGTTNVGSMSYTAIPDPNFPGGFAGIASTLPFDRVELTFDASAQAFAADNFRVTAVPEPTTLGMFTLGICALLLRQKRKVT